MIIFADEKHRQLPNAGHVQSLVKGTVIDRSITKKSHRNLFAPQQFEAVSRTRRLQNARSDDSAGAHHSNFGCEQMHAASPPPRATRRSAIQFRKELLWREPLGQCVAVTA